MSSDESHAGRYVNTVRLDVTIGVLLIVAGLGITVLSAWMDGQPFLANIVNQLGLALMVAGLLDLLLSAGLRHMKEVLAKPYLDREKRFTDVREGMDELGQKIDRTFNQTFLSSILSAISHLEERLVEVEKHAGATREAVDHQYADNMQRHREYVRLGEEEAKAKQAEKPVKSEG